MKKYSVLLCELFFCCCLLAAESKYGTLKSRENLQSESLSAVGEATGNRYRFIDDVAGSSSDGAEMTVRTYLYAGSTPVSVTSDTRTLNITTDIRGSVRALTDRYGMIVSSCDYDEFGIPLSPEINVLCGLCFAGKQYDAATGFLNYGFRDYNPRDGRFTTADPVRWGQNWYVYADNDPVNFVDLWGLNNVKPVALTMQNEKWGKMVLGGILSEGALLVENAGCYLTGYSSAAITLTGNGFYTPDFFNTMSELFTDDQLFNSVNASQIIGLETDYWTKAVQGNLSKKIEELNQADDEYVIMAQVPYDESGHLHWIEVYGEADDDGWINVVGTSENDTAGNSLRTALSDVWKFTENEIQVNTEDITQIRTFTAEKTKESTLCGNKQQ